MNNADGISVEHYILERVTDACFWLFETTTIK